MRFLRASGNRGGAFVAAAALGIASLGGGVALASPSSGVEVQELGMVSVPFGMGDLTVGTDVTLRRIDVAPGGFTGWHWHEGMVYGYVAAGTLTRVFADCSEAQDPAGSVFQEVRGEDAVHQGVNRGDGVLTVFVVYTAERGEPSTIDAEAPACATES
ncbi:cupin domain-containing protein [Lolliginicoccus suaedae]|uniref:cupin domain-containing protein n=1 Tax=Lolliginicoccus suaedae TaxID=2605429 RepID=UPI0011EDF128|nr:cupin domain-containing protein [Lolliginicoccus suaedae]